MKYFVTGFLCCLTAFAHAQSWRAIEESARLLNAGKTPLSVQAMRLNQVAHIARLQHLRPIIFKPLAPLAEPKFVYATPADIPAHLQQYRQVLSEAETLRKEAASFLYYQSKPSESRSLSIQEKNYWLNKILPLRRRLLAAYSATRQDPTLSQALDYTTYFACLIEPSLTHTLAPKGSTSVRGALAVPDNFFLYPQGSLPLPYIDLAGKLVVMVNDNTSVLDFFEKHYQYGILFPDAKLRRYSSVSEFLLWYQSADPKPDIVFTDIQLDDSTGYHLAGELRRMGFEGGIIALTNYTETEKMARDLSRVGFDGMVSIAPQYLGKIPVSQRITQAAQVYYQQKVQNQAQ